MSLGRARDQENTLKVNIMQVAPIPAHFVLDGLHADLCPFDVYERLVTSGVQSSAMEHAQEFLRAAVVSHRGADKKPHVDIFAFVSPAVAGADHRMDLFPTINGVQQGAPAQAPPGLAVAHGMPFAQVQ